MRAVISFLIPALLLAGCAFPQEPLPTWTVLEVDYDELPGKVKTAFRRDFGEAEVTKVEKSTFESRMSGRPQKYRLLLQRPDTAILSAIYNEKGVREDEFDFWFHRDWNSDESRPQ